MKRMRRHGGFAMLDAMVALLLFAVALLAALAVLLQGMRATHGAMLTSRAVDLAADFLEEHRALPAGAAVEPLLAAWNQRLEQALPETSRATATQLVEPLLTVAAP